MESFDSSPNYMRATSNFDAKKESSSQGGSECDEIICVSSSTCGSEINGPFTPKSSSEIKIKTKNNRKNYVSVRSIRRRAKSRIIQTPVEMSDDSLSAVGSPNYLKATSCSKGKKTSSRDSESRLVRNGSLKTISRTSSGLRNVRILIKKASFKPKRGLMDYSRVSEGVSVNRATYSSTIKGAKIPEPLERKNVKEDNNLGIEVCRYHHCSLHGGCRGAHDDPVPPLKHFLYKKRRSLKKQRSMVPKPELRVEKKLSSEKRKNLKKGQEDSIIESSNFGVESKNGVDSYEEINGKTGYDAFGDECGVVEDWGMFEMAYGETSFPEISYHDNLAILRKYEHDFGEIPFGLSGHCLRCSCQNEEQISSSDFGNVYKPEAQYNDVSDIVKSTLFEKSDEYHENEESNKDSRKTADILDEVTEKNSVFSINGSYEEEEIIPESTSTGDSIVNEDTQVKDSETDSPTQEGCKIQFSKPRHISMWNLIHEHMSSNLAVESSNTPRDGSESPVINESLGNSEIQEIEDRKLIAIKLVREAIEKILLPEIQDQTSDDMSITSEDTPRSEPIEKNLSDAFIEENHGDSSDAAKLENEVSSKPKPETHKTDDDSLASETIEQTEKPIISKPEKKSAPKHWSNLKKWILLQRFFRELEKVKNFNPKKPQLLPLNPDPEAEKVNLRPQTVESRKRSEEWMLDYALRRAVGQLAPTQKKKVGLLVKAFETVVPTQEDHPRAQFKALRLREKATVDKEDKKIDEKLTEEKGSCNDSIEPLKSTENEESEYPDNESIPIGEEIKPEDEHEDKTSKKNRIKMWHMIYQHVVSGIAEKVGSHLLDGSDEEEEEETNGVDRSTKSDALKLVIKEAMNEIMLDESSDTQSMTSESNLDREISSEVVKGKNWSKLKRVILVKRSIRALEKAREVKRGREPLVAGPGEAGPSGPEKVDLRRQMMEEKRKAEQWMLDYAVQHIVGKLTPARKRRVSMLVEAFEAVVPLPEM